MCVCVCVCACVSVCVCVCVVFVSLFVCVSGINSVREQSINCTFIYELYLA